MVIQDDLVIQESLVELLEDDGYGFKTAKFGEQGLRVLDKNTKPSRPVVLDLMMAVMGGIDFAR